MGRKQPNPPPPDISQKPAPPPAPPRKAVLGSENAPGTIEIKINGEVHIFTGTFTYRIGPHLLTES